jgi:hypothetical protein
VYVKADFATILAVAALAQLVRAPDCGPDVLALILLSKFAV